jgi:hypothetical protein
MGYIDAFGHKLYAFGIKMGQLSVVCCPLLDKILMEMQVAEDEKNFNRLKP